jgi:hypothetical protein
MVVVEARFILRIGMLSANQRRDGHKFHIAHKSVAVAVAVALSRTAPAIRLACSHPISIIRMAAGKTLLFSGAGTLSKPILSYNGNVLEVDDAVFIKIALRKDRDLA